MITLNSTDMQTKADTSSLVTLFKRHTVDHDQPARVFFEERSLSYPELDIASDSISDFLMAHKLPAEALVAVLLPRSIEAISSQLGILKAGGAYLPLSPVDFPIDRLCMIFEDAQVDFVITDSRYQQLCQTLQEKLGRSLNCFLTDKAETNIAYIDNKETEKVNVQEETDKVDTQSHPDHLAYVMYTSGSTGKPKGVMVTQQNIICSVTNTDYFTLEKNDAFLHAAPISFDAATFEIWAALLNGKDLYIVPDKIVHQFDAFSDFVNSRPVTIAWLTSALFNLLADARPAFFQTFKQILVGGEALSPRHINLIRKRYPELVIRNNYGPTENTIFSTSFLIDQDYQTNIPIGRAIRHKRAYILDKNFQQITEGMEGELYVAGKGVSPGYLNLADENRHRFLPDPFYPYEKMYATGDICRYNKQGDIEFIGRKDKQVKVAGHRIELGDIESALHTFPQIKLAVVLYKQINTSAKALVAYIKGASIDENALKRQLSETLPHYMVPVYVERLEDMPLTVNAKIDRKVMQDWPIKAKKQASTQSQTIQHTVIKACLTLLDLETLDCSQNFFELGGDSLLGTSLIIELEQQLGICVPLQVLYEHPRITDLVSKLEQLCALAKFGHAPVQPTEIFSLASEARLHEKIRLAGREVHSCSNLKAANTQILMTGASGFFGTFLLKELLDTTAGRVYCLVRARDEAHAKRRLLEKFREYKIPVSTRQIERIVCIPGDLSLTQMGLTDEHYAFLANNMDVIFHNGAAVNYVDTYATLKGPNVIGTQEVLKLSCRTRIIPVHYISSVSVFETLGYFTGKQVIYENEAVDISEEYVRLGYSKSKWVAEKMMDNARAAGLPINIYRSGYIMGHSETGVSNTTDHIARYIAGCIEMGSAPILQEYASLSPVDQLSQAFCHVALNLQKHGNTFHLCNPDFITVDAIYRKIQEAGFPLELLPYAQWKQRLKSEPSSNPLYPLLSLHIHNAPNHKLTLPELYEHNTRFDCRQFLAELEGSGIKISLNTPYLFERWLQDYLRKGLISEAAFNQTRALDCIA